MKFYQITCATVSDYDPTPGGITHVGGPGFYTLTRQDAVNLIDNRSAGFYTLDRNGNRAEVYTVHPKYGLAYITTSPDGSKGNNLLNLGSCVR